MKHIVIGGDGFVGRQLASDLSELGEQVVVADIQQSDHAIYRRVPFIAVDVTQPQSLQRIPLAAGDVVYNMSAKMLSPIMPRAKRHDFFWPVNYHGVRNILQWMEPRGARDLVHFTTDMIYGTALTVPQNEDHPKNPLGEYGRSKLASEALCVEYRQKGFRIPIFRPRLIIGPGRLGILVKLFRLIDLSLPVPMIGSGTNPYQFISVFDCASAARLAWQAGMPSREYNLGSDNPPPVRELLGALIRRAGSHSFLLPTPAPLVKLVLTGLDRVNLPLMDPEQYLIADEHCIVDTTRATRDLGWTPRFNDTDMLIAAYEEYRSARAGRAAASLGKDIAA
ncbi:MAG: NAD(P)-dependent oxidoreductase [Hyphomicrobiaceae bacterium]